MRVVVDKCMNTTDAPRSLVLKVLKCIMLREGYLSRVTRLAEDISRKAKRGRGQMHTLPAGMIDLLDLLRTATLDSVEAISLWRLSQAGLTPDGSDMCCKVVVFEG